MNNTGIVGVAIVITRDNHVLLTLRNAGENIGTWELPAGHVRENETPDKTAVREVREETGISISKIESLKTVGKTNIYRAVKFSGDPTNLEPDQHSDIRWWPINALPSPLGPSANWVISHQKINPNNYFILKVITPVLSLLISIVFILPQISQYFEKITLQFNLKGDNVAGDKIENYINTETQQRALDDKTKKKLDESLNFKTTPYIRIRYEYDSETAEYVAQIAKYLREKGYTVYDDYHSNQTGIKRKEFSITTPDNSNIATIIIGTL